MPTHIMPSADESIPADWMLHYVQRANLEGLRKVIPNVKVYSAECVRAALDNDVANALAPGNIAIPEEGSWMRLVLSHGCQIDKECVQTAVRYYKNKLITRDQLGELLIPDSSDSKGLLSDAIISKDIDTVRELISLGVPVKYYHLKDAIFAESNRIFDVLLAACRSLVDPRHVHTDTYDCCDCVYKACVYNNRYIFNKLLEKGAPICELVLNGAIKFHDDALIQTLINDRREYQRTGTSRFNHVSLLGVKHLCVSPYVLQHAIYSNKPELVRVLCEYIRPSYNPNNEKVPEFDLDDCQYTGDAFNNGNPQIFEMIHKMGCPISQLTIMRMLMCERYGTVKPGRSVILGLPTMVAVMETARQTYRSLPYGYNEPY